MRKRSACKLKPALSPAGVGVTILCIVGTIGAASRPSIADEGGVSFWLPGNFGSLAAVPGTPGWSLALTYYHATADAGGGKSFPIGARITAGLDARADLLFASPTYTFDDPVLGGQAAITLTGVYGRSKVSVEQTIIGPAGGALSGGQSDSRTGVGDLYPSASLRWNNGNHNYLAYTMAGVPVGVYDASRLANIGTNHWAVDAGGGYTYFDQTSGREFSATLGATYNFENPDTDYRNGISLHLDLGASQFLSEQLHVGLVGYVYNQLTGDSGDGARLGDFKSRVAAIGPQAGYLFNLGGRLWYANVKGYYEFAAENRPEGWNAWLTVAIPFGSSS